MTVANTFSKIAEFPYSAEARIIKGKLESAGIETFLRDDITIDSDPLLSQAIGGVKLFVRTEDLPRAQAVLAEVSVYSKDDSGNPVACPACGSEHVRLLTSIRDFGSAAAFFVSLVMGALPFYSKYRYRCDDCGREFSAK